MEARTRIAYTLAQTPSVVSSSLAAQDRTYDKVIEELAQQKLQQQEKELKYAQEWKTEVENDVRRVQVKKLKLREFSDDLKGQIEELNRRKAKEVEYKRLPGISEQMHGYPSLPETPDAERRRRKKAVQDILKADLESQIKVHSENNRLKKRNELMKDQEILEKTKQEIELDKQMKFSKRQQEKDMLSNCWEKSHQVKNIHQTIENLRRYGIANQTIDGRINETEEEYHKEDNNHTELNNYTIVGSYQPISLKAEQIKNSYAAESAVISGPTHLGNAPLVSSPYLQKLEKMMNSVPNTSNQNLNQLTGRQKLAAELKLKMEEEERVRLQGQIQQMIESEAKVLKNKSVSPHKSALRERPKKEGQVDKSMCKDLESLRYNGPNLKSMSPTHIEKANGRVSPITPNPMRISIKRNLSMYGAQNINGPNRFKKN